MRKKILLSIFTIFLIGSMFAQRIATTGTTVLPDSTTYIVTPLEPASYGFREVILINGNRQYILPVYMKEALDSIDIVESEGYPELLCDNNNKVLSSYYHIFGSRMYQLFDGKIPTSEQDLMARKSLLVSADSLISVYQPDEIVEKYLRTWALVSIDSVDIAVFDNPISMLFPGVTQLIARQAPKGTLDEQFAYVDNLLKNKDLRESVKALLNYRYQMSLKPKKETPFPTDITLKDADGNTVDISKFKGKYLYIDMWASWCLPCIKEIPFLKEIEKNLQNPNVEIVSISIDQKKEAWLKKMTALGLQGNQLHDQGNVLAKNLKVEGIPHFVIYDPEGKLYMYKAPRPSDPSTLPLLESLK